VKVLVCHNFYQQPGGEDQVFADEVKLLQDNGHEVLRYTLHNDAIANGNGGVTGRLALMVDTLWNRKVHAELQELVRRERPAVVHFHNTFPLMSPAAYDAARSAGAAVVQTLHNYRLSCPGAEFRRDGRVCEDCMGRAFPWPGVVHGCYRGSRTASAAVAAMLSVHRARGTFRRDVDMYIALTEFARRKYVEGGLPAHRIVVKPNFVGEDHGPGDGRGDDRGPFGLFVGRLSPGKGVEVVLQAWADAGPGARLKVLGDGSLAPLVREAAAANPAIEWLGRRPLAEVYRIMGDAAFLVMPSTWYEAMPRTVVEAFSRGTPVIASRIGALEELVTPGRTGMHFNPGDPADLSAHLRWAFANGPSLSAMRPLARREYEEKYTAADNYRRLCQIYAQAQETRRARTRGPQSAQIIPAT
jgi:glycosyltransferase involved in cell wall biosynthesis